MAKKKPRGKSIIPARTVRHADKSARAVAKRAQISTVVLRSLAADCDLESGVKPPSVFDVKIQSQSRHQAVTEVKVVSQRLIVDVTFTISARYRPEDKDSPVKMSVKYRAIYGIMPGRKFTQSQIASFSALYTLPMVWPYMSELVHTISQRMGLPALRMPMYESGALQLTT